MVWTDCWNLPARPRRTDFFSMPRGQTRSMIYVLPSQHATSLRITLGKLLGDYNFWCKSSPHASEIDGQVIVCSVKVHEEITPHKTVTSEIYAWNLSLKFSRVLPKGWRIASPPPPPLPLPPPPLSLFFTFLFYVHLLESIREQRGFQR